MGDFFIGFLNLAIFIVGILLIGLILIQRGKGGGLAGAFGGAGGSSAFGSRAGDAFTRLTMYMAAVWLLMIMIQIRLVQPNRAAANTNASMEADDAVKKILDDAKDRKEDSPPPKGDPVPVEQPKDPKDGKEKEAKDKDAKEKETKDKDAKDKEVKDKDAKESKGK